MFLHLYIKGAVEHMIYAMEGYCRGEPVQSLDFDSRHIERMAVPVVVSFQNYIHVILLSCYCSMLLGLKRDW